MTSGGGAQTTYFPRGLTIATGEDLAGVEGILSRMFVVEMKREDIRSHLPQLTELQRHRERYCHAMSGYLYWLRENWSAYRKLLPERKEEYRQRALDDDIHLRFPEAMSSLAVGIEMGLRYALYLEALTQDEFSELLEAGWEALRDCVRNMAETAKAEKPEEMFLQTLGALMATGDIYLECLSDDGFTPETKQNRLPWTPGERSQHLGWYDDEYLYFYPPASTYKWVKTYFREQGEGFPVTRRTILKMLRDTGLSDVSGGRHLTKVIRLKDENRRVLAISRAGFEQVMDEVAEEISPDA
jgi:hypothetical protein